MFTTGLIEEHRMRDSVTPEELDVFLEAGWRHFGKLFSATMSR